MIPAANNMLLLALHWAGSRLQLCKATRAHMAAWGELPGPCLCSMMRPFLALLQNTAAGPRAQLD
jgi:hypothetical protein